LLAARLILSMRTRSRKRASVRNDVRAARVLDHEVRLDDLPLGDRPHVLGFLSDVDLGRRDRLGGGGGLGLRGLRGRGRGLLLGGLLGQGNPGRQERGDREPADFQDMMHLQFPPVFRDAEAHKPAGNGGYFRKPLN
jgi:hypothetical protein